MENAEETLFAEDTAESARMSDRPEDGTQASYEAAPADEISSAEDISESPTAGASDRTEEVSGTSDSKSEGASADQEHNGPDDPPADESNGASAAEPENTDITADAIRILLSQAEETAASYPDFSLSREMENPQFSAMVFQGIPVQTAYQALHMDEILTNAMHYAAGKARAQVASSIRAGAGRPPENGAAGRQPASHRFDPRSMTPEESRQLRERVYRGEKIYL